MSWIERMHANPSRMERILAIRLGEAGIQYKTQVELPVSTADLYFPTYPRPLVVFIDGPPHQKNSQIIKDEQIRRTLRMVGYRVLELPYERPTKTATDSLYKQILEELGTMRSYEQGGTVLVENHRRPL